MYKICLQILSLAFLAVGTFSCNPECESFPSNNIQLPPGPYQAGTELLITASPSNFIEGRSISIASAGVASQTLNELPTQFVAELGGSVVTLPANVSSDVSFFLDDPDCSGSVIPIGSETNIVDESFFVDNPFFITPTPPLIIIPSLPPTPPPAIVNAWFSPNNRDYCIWFQPVFDTLSPNNIVELPTLIPAGDPRLEDYFRGDGSPSPGSIELAVGCGGEAATDRFYHANPVSGVIDKENNVIRISIDRTSKGFGVEELTGQFIDAEQLPNPDYQLGGVCSSDSNEKPNIMLLTSSQTGRQMILFRGLD